MTTKEVLAIVAAKHNTTPEIVEQEIRKSIREAMATKDPRAQAMWKQIAPDGKEPSIDTFLQFCAKEVRKRMEGGQG